MNTRISIIAAGAILGGGVGYFVGGVVADYIDEKEIRDRADHISVSTDEEEVTDDEEESSTQSSNAMTKKQKKPTEKKQKTNYVSYFTSINRPDLAMLARKYNNGGDIDGDVKVTLIPDAETPENVDDNGITIISFEDFSENQDDFEVVELSYYADEIMVGDEDNIITRPEEIVGLDALVSFGSLSGDPDIVYVRNEKTRAYYEIVRTDAKYAIDADALEIKPRRGLKKGIDFDEVTDENEDNEEEHA